MIAISRLTVLALCLSAVALAAEPEVVLDAKISPWTLKARVVLAAEEAGYGLFIPSQADPCLYRGVPCTPAGADMPNQSDGPVARWEDISGWEGTLDGDGRIVWRHEYDGPEGESGLAVHTYRAGAT